MPRAASIHDLPVSLLEAVFGRLKLHERCVAVPSCPLLPGLGRLQALQSLYGQTTLPWWMEVLAGMSRQRLSAQPTPRHHCFCRILQAVLHPPGVLALERGCA
jgi:hypothetical protein